jgi:hypothetical protein
MTKPVKKISDWAICLHVEGDYSAPETWSGILTGINEEGRFIHTSKIVKMGSTSIETMNTIYMLGKMSEDYRLFLENTPRNDDICFGL